MSEENKNLPQVYIDNPGKLIQVRHTAKFTPAKKKVFLKYLAEVGFNFTQAAMKAGVTRYTVINHIKDDPTFAAAVNKIKDAYIDQVEQAGFFVALHPSREGFNDRKLMLQAHRREQYAPQLNVEIDQQITINQAPGLLRSMIARALKADSEEIEPEVQIAQVVDNDSVK